MIRFAIRWFVRASCLFLLLAAAAYLLRHVLVRELIRSRLRSVTGLETRLDRARLGLTEGSLTLEGLHVFNAPAFGGSTLLQVPELHLAVDGRAVTRGELRFSEIRLHVAEANLVRSREGRTNVFEIADHVSTHAGPLDALLVSPAGLSFGGIETLRLTVGTVRWIDLGRPEPPREFPIALTNEVLRDVRSKDDFGPLLVRIVAQEIADALGAKPR